MGKIRAEIRTSNTLSVRGRNDTAEVSSREKKNRENLILGFRSKPRSTKSACQRSRSLPIAIASQTFKKFQNKRLSTRLPSKFQPCRSYKDSFHQIPHPFAQLHCHTKMHQEASISEFEKRTGCERASRVGSLNIVGAADESLEMNALPLLPSYEILRSSLNPRSPNARKLFPTSFQWLSYKASSSFLQEARFFIQHNTPSSIHNPYHSSSIQSLKVF